VAVVWLTQGQDAYSRSRRRRPPRTRCPAAENKGSRKRLGFSGPREAIKGEHLLQTRSSQAIATGSHQIWSWSKPCRGRLRGPVSLAHRMRSSQRARRR
jgi:hypothetical protein